MDTLLLMLICGGGYLVAYHTYGRVLAKKIFKLDKNALVPSVERQDGVDYVPTRKGIIFGHHYTSIAGTGPIVGPAIGVIWGWLPAILWVFFGSIFMGAVHDFGALVISLRNEGNSISEVAAKYINMRVRFIFFAVVFLSLLIVIAIFGVVIAAVFTTFPSSVVPVWLQIPIAVALGFAVYKKTANVVIATAVAVIGMYLCIAIGSLITVHLGTAFGIPPTGLWVIILLIYAWVASNAAGDNAASASRLYQCLAALYRNGPFGCWSFGIFVVRWSSSCRAGFQQGASRRHSADLAIYVRYNRLRCHQRLPFPCRLRHEFKTSRKRNRLSICRLRFDAARELSGRAGSGLCRSRYWNSTKAR